MSPAAASAISIVLQPLNANSFVTLVSCTCWSSLHTATGSPIFTRPLKMRPIAIRPT